MAATTLAAPHEEEQSRPVSTRITLSDLIVIVGAIAAILIGWGIKSWHDQRLLDTTASGVSISYPRGWIQLPPTAPAVFKVISNTDGNTTVFLTEAATQQKDATHLLATSSANPALSEPGYTQLSSRGITVDGTKAVQTDYAYVKTTIGGATVPVVMRGRQVAWIKGGKVYVFALEATNAHWDDIQGDFSRWVGKIKL